ncbi:MAG: hypothetical protein QF393_16480 [Rhodospirillales bacterium]|nr:hypothetical protein [Rhodospirillales bacterium]
MALGWLAEGVGFQASLGIAAALAIVLMALSARRMYRACSLPERNGSAAG